MWLRWLSVNHLCQCWVHKLFSELLNIGFGDSQDFEPAFCAVATFATSGTGVFDD